MPGLREELDAFEDRLIKRLDDRFVTKDKLLPLLSVITGVGIILGFLADKYFNI